MKKSRLVITLIVLFVLIPICLISYNFFRPDFSKKQCETIREQYTNIKIGMNKEEVLLLLDSKVRSKVFPNPKVIFPEQETQWEVWLLCADLNSCVITDAGRNQCYKWLMVAFNTKTGEVVKIFSDDPERVGFV